MPFIEHSKRSPHCSAVQSLIIKIDVIGHGDISRRPILLCQEPVAAEKQTSRPRIISYCFSGVGGFSDSGAGALVGAALAAVMASTVLC